MRLEERGLVKRLRDEQDHRILEITPLATKSYFSSSDGKDLDVPPDSTQDEATGES